MRTIEATSSEDVRRWLNVTTHQWDQLVDRGVVRDLVTACGPFRDMALLVVQAKFALGVLYGDADDSLKTRIAEMGDRLQEVRDLVKRGVLSRSPHRVVATLMARFDDSKDLKDRFCETETRSILPIVQSQQPKQASLLQFVTDNPMVPRTAWESARPNFETVWDEYLRLAEPEIRTLIRDISASVPEEPKGKLQRAASLLEGQLQHRLNDLATAVDQRSKVRLGSYLDEVRSADTQTARFVFENVGTKDPELREFHEGQDPRRPTMYAARVTNPLVLTALNRHMVTDHRGRYSYRVYRFGADTAILYDGWMLARHPSLLDEISDGRVLKTRRASTFFKVATVLRCTFTGNADLDQHFLDYLRGMDARKVGGVWEIPVRDSSDMTALQVALKRDWGYPYVYECREDESFGGPVRRDSMPADGVMRLSGMCRFVAVDHEVPTDVDPQVLRDAQVRLRRAASMVPKIAARLGRLALKTVVVAHWICVPRLVKDHTGQLPHPPRGARLAIGDRDFRVERLATQAPAWLNVTEDGVPHVVLRPDLRGRGACLTVEQFEEIQVQALASGVAVRLPRGTQVWQIPTVNVNGQVVTAASPMGGTESWSPTFPSGFIPTSQFPDEPDVLYYPSPDHLQPAYDDKHYKQVPVEIMEELPEESLIDPDRRQIEVYPEGTGQQPEGQKHFGPHPGVSFNTSEKPGVGPQYPVPYDPFFPLNKAT